MVPPIESDDHKLVQKPGVPRLCTRDFFKLPAITYVAELVLDTLTQLMSTERLFSTQDKNLTASSDSRLMSSIKIKLFTYSVMSSPYSAFANFCKIAFWKPDYNVDLDSSFYYRSIYNLGLHCNQVPALIYSSYTCPVIMVHNC